MMMKDRRQQSLDVRRAAAELAAARPQPVHRSNGDEQRQRFEHDEAKDAQVRSDRPSYAGNFTKGLPHDDDGFVRDPHDYEAWVRSIDSGDPRDIRRLRLGPGPFLANGELQYENMLDEKSEPELDWKHTYPSDKKPKLRGWESQGAGLTFDLEGPDAQSVTLPPCPSLDSQELIAEMGELYWMALCRDSAFINWQGDAQIDAARESLKRLWWFRRDHALDLGGATDRMPASLNRRRILSENGSQAVPLNQLFRGVTPGEQTGPYLSQFLLIGNTGLTDAQQIDAGMIEYGSLRIDQRVRHATPGKDYMLDWNEWLDVQNGANLRHRETYAAPGYRFIATPRDLATYVHYDALYEAYLNACLILIGLDVARDPGLPFELDDHRDRQTSFAQFGAPHVLTLVTEVATRALKAVRFQKYNVHRRLRPEAVGGWMYQRRNGTPAVKARLASLQAMEDAFLGSSGLGGRLDAGNGADNWLLPMAFTEGSPMHPAYGAGHATVAGACVTILKAWFDCGQPLLHPAKIPFDSRNPVIAKGEPIAYVALADGSALQNVNANLASPLTVEGELNKLAANIAIGRNWGGVHYYSDYIESLRLGEQIALGLLQEQKLTYGENFSLTVPLFDGTTVRI